MAMSDPTDGKKVAGRCLPDLEASNRGQSSAQDSGVGYWRTRESAGLGLSLEIGVRYRIIESFAELLHQGT